MPDLTMLDNGEGSQDDDGMDGDYRVGDADREQVMALLQAHCGAGRLSLDELLERYDTARAAVTRSELDLVLRDLPDDSSAQRRGWRDPGWRTHAMVAVLTTGGVIGLWQLTRDPTPAPQDYGADYWWPLWFGLLWAVAVLLHYLYAAGRLRLPARARPLIDGGQAGGGRAGGGPPAPPAPAGARSGPSTVEPAGAGVLGALTEREREILVLVAEGCANKEIARRLFISERTARTHVSNILRKLELPSRTQAALFAVRAGLVAPHRDRPAG